MFSCLIKSRGKPYKGLQMCMTAVSQMRGFFRDAEGITIFPTQFPLWPKFYLAELSKNTAISSWWNLTGQIRDPDDGIIGISTYRGGWFKDYSSTEWLKTNFLKRVYGQKSNKTFIMFSFFQPCEENKGEGQPLIRRHLTSAPCQICIE